MRTRILFLTNQDRTYFYIEPQNQWRFWGGGDRGLDPPVVCINNTVTDFLQWFCTEGKSRNSVSAVYYPIKIVEIVNTVLSLMHPGSEWGICLIFQVCLCPSNKKKPSPSCPEQQADLVCREYFVKWQQNEYFLLNPDGAIFLQLLHFAFKLTADWWINAETTMGV